MTLKCKIFPVTFDLIEHNQKKSHPASTNETQRPFSPQSVHFEISLSIRGFLAPSLRREVAQTRKMAAQTKYKRLTLFSAQSDHFEFLFLQQATDHDNLFVLHKISNRLVYNMMIFDEFGILFQF